MRTRSLYILLYIAAVLITTTACSTHKNTSRSRWWHSFTARYNTYYNGSVAFTDGNLEKEKGNHDNYTERLPLYPVGNKQSRQLGSGQYDRTIEKMEKAIKLHSIKARPEWNKSRRKTAKDREWLGRKEYNPFLWRAWLLMGQAQFQKGEFDEAAATFNYMNRLYETQPAISGRARAWLAKCYVEQGWLYDAEDIIRNQIRDSMDYRTVRDWDATLADYYLKAGELSKATGYLRRVISHERRKKQKARLWFLMGQIETELGHRDNAYRAYQHAIRQNPPYELEFNARIAQTEVMARGNTKKMIGRLRRMASNDNNKEYLDQVYYAIGNIYLSQHDTVQAINAYEQGNTKATRSGIEKGVLLLRLGNLYWDCERYADAQRCYGEAIGLLDKDRPDYEELSNRSKKLDELVPHTEAIHLQDSLLQLAAMPEKERLEAIDRVINELKRKEKEERDRQREAEVEQQLQRQGAVGNRTQQNQRTPSASSLEKGGAWYFYNPTVVNQGKQQFQRQWGRRDNQDDWQRQNRTVVPTVADTTEPADTLAQANDSISTELGDNTEPGGEGTPADTLANDPHNREYYLAQIPFTPEQQAESHAIIRDALFASGVVFKDKLDNLPLARRQLLRLISQYPDFEQMDEVWYHLFLLYSRLGDTEQAQRCIGHLQAEHPESEWTILLCDPNYSENQRFGQHIEDSLYAATYDAFNLGATTVVTANARLSAERFPLGQHRPKFIFIDGISQLNDGQADYCLEQMREVVEKYPQSEVSPIAGMIIKGVQEGRPLHGGRFDLGDIWSRRDVALTTSADSTRTDTLSADRNVGFIFLLLYQPDSLVNPVAKRTDMEDFLDVPANADKLPEHQLLYEMARYNFTNFAVRNFDLETDDASSGVRRLLISGFLSYDEALQYARQLHADGALSHWLRQCRTFIVSESNLPLLGTRFSYADYQEFYDHTFLPLKVTTEPLLTIPDLPAPEEDADEDSNAGDEPDEDSQPDAGSFDFDDDFF